MIHLLDLHALEVSSAVKASLTEAIEQILTPKKSIDVLRAALQAKAAGRVCAEQRHRLGSRSDLLAPGGEDC